MPSEVPRPSVADAFARTPRRDFLPAAERGQSGIDAPLDIGFGQTNSQPTTVRNMLELLDVRPGHRVLDVGAGSGWTTALLAHLVGEGGRVLGVERITDLAERAGRAVAARNLGWAEVRVARRGVLGWPEEAPFDRILVSAMARRFPEALADQLAPDGVLVVPVSGVMVRARRRGADLDVTRHGWYSFVPLIEE